MKEKSKKTYSRDWNEEKGIIRPRIHAINNILMTLKILR